MTSGGRRWAFIFGVVIAFMLPNHVECGYPNANAECARVVGHSQCIPYEVEPWGFSLIERLVGHDVGFAYSSGDDCN